MKKSAQSVQDALDAAGLATQVVELPDSTRSAQEAASAIGCAVAQIAKSIVFRAAVSGEAVMVLAAGDNRIDTSKVAEVLGERLGRAKPDFVRQATGFAIGGVPPCGHKNMLQIFVDRDLLDHEEVWAAAGTPNAVFRLSPTDLVRLTGGRVLAVS